MSRKYRPIIKDGTHLGGSHETDGAVRGLLFDDTTNRLVGQADWIEDDDDPSPEPSLGGLGTAIAAVAGTAAVTLVFSSLVKRWRKKREDPQGAIETTATNEPTQAVASPWAPPLQLPFSSVPTWTPYAYPPPAYAYPPPAYAYPPPAYAYPPPAYAYPPPAYAYPPPATAPIESANFQKVVDQVIDATQSCCLPTPGTPPEAVSVGSAEPDRKMIEASGTNRGTETHSSHHLQKNFMDFLRSRVGVHRHP